MVPPDPAPATRAGRLAGLAAPGAIAVAFVLLALRSWNRWADPWVDFGKELYFAWRITAGDVLYADLPHYLGPLSHHWNALWFVVLGPGLRTLAGVNLALLAGLTAGLYHLLRRMAGPWPSAAAVITGLVLCGFGHHVRTGNYNFVTPYTHEALHGFLLATAAVALYLHGRGRRGAWTVAAGVALGLAVLTRPEPVLAASAALAAALIADPPQRGRTAALLAAGAAVPVVASVALLALVLPPVDALAGTFAGFATALNAEVRALPFNRAVMGLEAPGANLLRLAFAAGGVAAVVAALLAVARTLPRRVALAAAAGLGVAAVAIATTRGEAWRVAIAYDTPRVLPLIALVCVVAWAAVVRRGRQDGDVADPRAVPALVFSVFALAMLAKMPLHAAIHHYGFTLALPAVLLGVVLLLDWLPGRLAAAGGNGRAFAVGAVGAVAAWTVTADGFQAAWYRGKTVAVGAGADRFLAAGGAGELNVVLDRLKGTIGSRDMLAALPEGAMVNYLLRVPNPTPYVNVMPHECALWGEDAILAAYRAAPPDHLLLVHKDTSDHGFRWFGRDYARGFPPWVAAEYRRVETVGAEPFTGDRFGVLITRRR